MGSPLIKVETIGDVCVIRFDDPATRNAVTKDMAWALDAALEAAPRTSRAVLLTGEGKAFCSGARIGDDLDPLADDYDVGEQLETHFNPLMERIRRLPIPIVTAVNGAAAGIGASFALAGDLVIIGDSGFFLEVFCHVGLIPDGGAAFLLQKSIGLRRASEMMLLGERVGAEQALNWGLVNRVAPDDELFAVALRFAATLAAGPTKALGMTRRLAWDATEAPFSEILALERALQREAGLGAEHREGVAAFRSKRRPKFS